MQKSLSTLEPIKHHQAKSHGRTRPPGAALSPESRFRRHRWLVLGGAAILGAGTPLSR